MNEKGRTLRLMRRFIPYFKSYRKILLLDLLCALLTTLCDIVLPLIIRYITNTGMNDIAALTVGTILTLGAVYLVLRIIDAAANYYMNYIGHVMGARIETDMRRDLFAHMQKLSFTYYDNTKIGQLMSRLTNDLFEITEFAHHCPEEFFIAAIKIIASASILATMNGWLTLIVFIMFPIMLFCCSFFNIRMRAAFKKSRQQVGEINAVSEDSLQGIRVVKSFANEHIENDKFEQGNSEFLNIKKEVYRNMSGFNTTTRIFDGLMYITIVVVGSLFMINGTITPADLVAFLLYITTLLNSVRRIVEFAEQFQRGISGIERFTEVMDEEPENFDSGNIELENVRGDIKFDNVSFHYSDDNANVLTNIELDIKAGESVALVGPSGGGKTTLCSLIPRFYELTGGAIYLDGVNVKDIKLTSLRENIGVVQQDVYLFAGTVLENIAYGKPGATREEIIEAAKQAGAHEFISSFPAGYDTYVGERGIRLSGGQKQRVSIARVFLKNPPVLILDEATSALDNESERIVQHSLTKLAKGRTTFTIAHRLTTIRGAKVILVLTQDGIVEQGNHEELMAKNGVYAGYYKMYSGENGKM